MVRIVDYILLVGILNLIEICASPVAPQLVHLCRSNDAFYGLIALGSTAKVKHLCAVLWPPRSKLRVRSS